MFNPKLDKVLDQRFPNMMKYFRDFHTECENSSFKVVASKSGELTLYKSEDGKEVYWHSKYNPTQEAINIVAKYDELAEFDTVLLYGYGLGYHGEQVLRQFPDKKIVVYEPEPAIFYLMLKSGLLSKRMLNNIQFICLETDPQMVKVYAEFLANQLTGNTLLIVHPSYERLLGDRTQNFISEYAEALRLKKHSYRITDAYEELWVINSIVNMRKVLETPSYVQYKEIFEGKPVILVSAGPSLQEEIENLRIIRDNNMAYILAVGSANKVLVSHKIYPHAVCGYDPAPTTRDVFLEIENEGIDQIPLFFGSSINAMALEKFPGQGIHMVTQSDTVTAYLLGKNYLDANDGIARNSPTIAGVMLDILCRFNARIILVGQNLALRDQQYYNEGIQYAHRPGEATEEEMKDITLVESVDGGTVATIFEFHIMKIQIEAIIADYPGKEIVNTTVGGAAIKGTVFRRLTEIMKEILAERTVEDLEIKENPYGHSSLIDRIDHLSHSSKEFREQLNKISDLLAKLMRSVEHRKENQVGKYFPLIDGAMREIGNNTFFQVIMEPMTKNKSTVMLQKVKEIRNTKNIFEKGKQIAESFGAYIYECQKGMPLGGGMIDHLLETKQRLLEKQAQ